ncbi:U1 zinc finger protein [Babesia ovis]|uniref:U1 zinc finger protein n=1 Tax=Babesia ovis TaxID=5869 RepID=A0A9W5T8V5_BABOV|nr:U1 zinc finger protein [Babesia ovis]
MPKFYCEYCGIYLTHSSPAGRKQHSTGRKHINMKVDYYQKLVREHFFQPPPYTVGAAPPGGFPPVVPGAVPAQTPVEVPKIPSATGFSAERQPVMGMMPPAPPIPGAMPHPPPPYGAPTGAPMASPTPPYGIR